MSYILCVVHCIFTYEVSQYHLLPPVQVLRCFEKSHEQSIWLQVTFEQRETKHRVIVGKEYYEPYGLEPELVVERVFSFLLAKRVQRQTEGSSLCSLFLQKNTPSVAEAMFLTFFLMNMRDP